jgi:enoyl-CoA hydratase/carnithine racemase
LVDFVDREPAEASFRYTVDLVAEMWSSAEAAEGIASFLNKREPNWRPGAVSNQPQA